MYMKITHRWFIQSTGHELRFSCTVPYRLRSRTPPRVQLLEATYQPKKKSKPKTNKQTNEKLEEPRVLV